MRSRAIYDYIKCGTGLRFLQDSAAGRTIHGEGRVVRNLEIVLGALVEFGLPVTLRAAGPLKELLAELKATDAEAKLTADQARRMSKACADLRTTLTAETSGTFAYIVTDKRLALEKLLGSPSSLFRPTVFAALTDIAKYDITEACRCIAFERATAAAFHTLRGTESVLREFYFSRVKRNRVDPPMWGPVLIHLRKIKKPPAPELLDNLDNIRRSFRNPTQHPDKIYDIHEAQDLFGLCVDVINRMGST